MNFKRLLLLRKVLMYSLSGILAQALLCSMLFASKSAAQKAVSVKEVTISVDFTNDNLTTVFEKLEESSGYNFVFSKKDLNKNVKVNGTYNKNAFYKVLMDISKQADLSFKQVNNNINVKKLKVGQESVEEMVTVVADKDIAGKIVDENGSGLPGAAITIQGGSQGTVTDFDGNYKLSVPDDAVITISFVGYVTQDIVVGSQSVIDISMVPDVETLSEIIVVGYGTQQKSSVTGAITQVTSKEITGTPVLSASQALQGRAAGVTVVNSGAPGTSPTVRIRGLSTINDNNPLYVIDGMIGGDLNTINVNDIESIDVQKDAAAVAIYGSRASNGVIIITTKKGTKGETTINVDAYRGISTVGKRFDLLNTAQYEAYATDLEVNAGRTAPARFSDPSYSTLRNNNTDWMDLIFKSGRIESYNLSASGGGENSRYNVGAGYFNQDGSMLNTGFKRANVRINSEFDKKGFVFGETLNIGMSKTLAEVNAGGRSQIEHAIKAAPYLPVYNPANKGGFQGPLLIDDNDAINPVRSATLNDNVTNRISINGTLYGQYEIIDGLRYKITLGLNLLNRSRFIFSPAFYDSEVHNAGESSQSQLRSNNTSFLITNSLSYTKTFAEDHSITALLVAEQQTTKYDQLSGSSENSISNAIKEINSVERPNVDSRTSENAIISYLGRLNYAFKDKYLVQASFRRDGASRFAPDQRWGTFPGLSLGWRMNEEAFLSDAGSLSDLKLRASWGKVGNWNLGDYPYTSTIASNWNYIVGGSRVGGNTINDLPNEAVTWETTTMTNFGVDFGFMEGKLYGSIEYYNNETENMLYQKPIPNSLGYTSNPTVNVGSVKAKGMDFTVGYRQSTGDFTWSADLNFSTNSNELTSLGGVDGFNAVSFEGDNIVRFAVGESIGSFYGWETDGLFQNLSDIQNHADQGNSPYESDGTTLKSTAFTQTTAPGDVRFVDQTTFDEDGNEVAPDGQINDQDRVILGNAFPDVTYGANFNAAYKGFDFNLFINGVSGNQIWNTNVFDLEGQTRVFNAGTEVLGRWTGEGTSNDVPRAVSGDPAKNIRASDRFLESGAFMRLRNITLGYSIPTENILGGNLTKLRVYVSAQNILTITDYSGFDPEIGVSRGVSSNSNDYTARLGIDYGNYPQPKTILGGIQITF